MSFNEETFKYNFGECVKDFKIYTLEDISCKDKKSIISGPFGSNISSKFFTETGVPVIRGNNVTTDSTKFIDDGFVFVSEEKADSLNTYAEEDDLVFTAAGTIGQVGIIPKERKYEKYIISNKQLRARLDKDRINPIYAYYWYSSAKMNKYINLLNTGSTIPLINLGILKKLPIALPSKKEQDKVVDIISSLDDKIEVNNKINQKLEEMAQAIFKQWFIDFDFPNKEGKPYKSSGGEMVESELGMIPKGWVVGVFRNYTTDILGGDWGKDSSQGNYIREVQCIRGADIPEINKGNEGKAPIRFIIEKNFNNKHLKEGNLIVEISGGSPTQSTGRITYVNKSVLDKFKKDIVCTNFCRAITLKDRRLMEFVYVYWTYLYNLDVFFQFENGTTGIKNLDINNFLDRWNIVNPNEELIYKYYKLTSDLFTKIQENGEENEKLSKLRDTLLPKLMSGEIRVQINN